MKVDYSSKSQLCPGFAFIPEYVSGELYIRGRKDSFPLKEIMKWILRELASAYLEEEEVGV